MRGVVVTADDESVVGATVKAKGTSIGTQTDIDGNFRLTVPADVKRLTVSYVGMFPVEVAVKPEVRIVMENDEQMLDEVVVTGLRLDPQGGLHRRCIGGGRRCGRPQERRQLREVARRHCDRLPV